jgi:hypothetical protein
MMYGHACMAAAALEERYFEDLMLPEVARIVEVHSNRSAARIVRSIYQPFKQEPRKIAEMPKMAELLGLANY